MPGNSFHSVDNPQYIRDYAESLAQRARDLTDFSESKIGEYKPFKRYTPAQMEQYEQERRRLGALRAPEQAKYAISVTGHSKPLPMTFEEMSALSQDRELAKQLFRESTGRSASDRDISEFSKRINSKLQPALRQRAIDSEFQRLGTALEEARGLRNSAEQDLQNAPPGAIPNARIQRNPYEGATDGLWRAKRYYSDLGIPEDQIREMHEVEYYTQQAQREKDWRPEGIAPAAVNPAQIKFQRAEQAMRAAEERLRSFESARREGRFLPQRIDGHNPQIGRGIDDQMPRGLEMNEYEYNAPDDGFVPPLERIDVHDLLDRAGAPKQLDAITAKMGRVAPMNELHEQAADIMQNSLNDESMDLARSQLKQADSSNILLNVEDRIDNATQDPRVAMHMFANDYGDKYEQEYMNKELQDAERRFFEKVVPKINYSFAHHGAFNSGARNKKIDEARKEMSRELGEKQKVLREQLRHEGVKVGSSLFNEQQQRVLGGAQLMGNATQQQQAHHRQLGQLHREQGVVNQAIAQNQASSIGALGHAKQGQEQNQINQQMREEAEARNWPIQQLNAQRALMENMPLPQSEAWSNVRDVPLPPNPYNLAGGALGALLGQPASHQRAASGGHIRSRFAEGGSVEDYNKYRNLQEQQALAYAGDANNRRAPDSGRNLMYHAGQQMLEHSRGDPLENFGRGMRLAKDDMDSTMARNDESKQKSFNMMNAINESRFKQHAFLSNLKQSENHFQSSLGQKERHHQDHLSLQMEHNEAKKHEVKAANVKLINEARQKLLQGKEIKSEAEEIKNLVKDTSTNPIWGLTSKFLPSENQDKLDKATTTAAINRLAAHKKPSLGVLKAIQDSKPGIGNYESTNLEATQKMYQEGDKLTQEGVELMRSLGMSDEEIQEEVKRIDAHKPAAMPGVGHSKQEKRSSSSSDLENFNKSSAKVKVRNTETGEIYNLSPKEAAEAVRDGGEYA